MDRIEMAQRPTGDPLLPRHVKHAIRYLRENLERKITLAELAHAAGTAERTLQKQFRQLLGMSPLGYLRRLRLLAARQEILQPDGGPIADIAMRLGCPHLGRFASDYRRCFGEPSSVTYQRVRAQRHESTISRVGPFSGRLSRDRPSLLVMPFHTETAAERTIAEALVEHIAASLSRTHAATVRLCNAGQLTALPHDRRAAGARYCLMGRLAHSGERLRVTLRLVDVAADRHVWGESFDGLTREPFALQDRVADGVLGGVLPALTQAEIERLRDRPCDTLGAREITLRALPLAFAVDIESANQLLTVTGEALEKDPGDALSVAMAALARAQIVNYLGTTAPAVERQIALRLWEQAGTLDDGDPLVLTARATAAASLYRSNDEVDALVTRALAVDPTLDWAWERKGRLRLNRGDDPNLAIADYKHALLLRGPRMPRTACLSGLAMAHMRAKRRAVGIEYCHRALAENPKAGWIHVDLICTYQAARDLPAMRRSADDFCRAWPHASVNLFAACRPGLPGLCLEIMNDAGLPP